jgi:hypothetical protein
MSQTVHLDKLFVLAANEAVKSYHYGDVIPKKWLLKKFNIEIPEVGTKVDYDECAYEYLCNIEAFKEVMLKEHKMYLHSVRGKGYLIVNPAQQTDYAMTRLISNVRAEMTKAVDTLNHINQDLLSFEDIKKRDDAQGKIAAFAAFRQKRLGV